MNRTQMPPPLKFSLSEAQAAADVWNFNCGPAALCAILGMTPDGVRYHLGDFEKKGYVNPTLMASILRGMGISFRRAYECAVKVENREPNYPTFGLIRWQWSGPWTKPGVPMAARYRHTHWTGCRTTEEGGREIFDINAMCDGGWLLWDEWSKQLVPWLLKQVLPKWDGTFWPTHCWEIEEAP